MYLFSLSSRVIFPRFRASNLVFCLDFTVWLTPLSNFNSQASALNPGYFPNLFILYTLPLLGPLKGSHSIMHMAKLFIYLLFYPQFLENLPLSPWLSHLPLSLTSQLMTTINTGPRFIKYPPLFPSVAHFPTSSEFNSWQTSTQFSLSDMDEVRHILIVTPFLLIFLSSLIGKWHHHHQASSLSHPFTMRIV